MSAVSRLLFNSCTLLGNIMAGYIMTGKIMAEFMKKNIFFFSFINFLKSFYRQNVAESFKNFRNF